MARDQKRSRKTDMRKQPTKDSGRKRVNFDNERASKFAEEYIARKEDARSNAYVWYAKSKEMTEAAGRVGFSQTTGLPDGSGLIVPGVMAINYACAVGTGAGSPINQAKDSIYSFTVHANSRNTSYDGTDQMMLIYAGKEVFRYLGNLIRAYGVMLNYTQLNSYTPDALLLAMGFDPDDLRANYNRMLFDINRCIAQSRQIWIPDTMPVVEREFWMNSHVYYDADNPKGQYYLYAPTQYYSLDETGSPNGTQLLSHQWGHFVTGTAVKWQDALNFFQNTLLNPLMNSTDRGLIMGDILKAYGEDRIYRIAELAPEYKVVPVYDKEVLSQIENATMSAVRPGNITQDPNTNRIVQGIYNFGADVSSRGLPLATVTLNLHEAGQPTPEQVIVASRMMAIGCATLLNEAGQIVGYMPQQYGTEYAQSMSIIFHDANMNLDSMAFYGSYGSNQSGLSFANIAKYYSNFDWAPAIYTYDTVDNVYGAHVTARMMDIDNYIVLDMATLGRMHTACVYSEYGVPVM